MSFCSQQILSVTASIIYALETMNHASSFCVYSCVCLFVLQRNLSFGRTPCFHCFALLCCPDPLFFKCGQIPSNKRPKPLFSDTRGSSRRNP